MPSAFLRLSFGTVITNADDYRRDTVTRRVETGEMTEQTAALGVEYPSSLYSLSHVALPFPMSEPLYGLTPDGIEHYGIELGPWRRGERNVLIASLNALLRIRFLAL